MTVYMSDNVIIDDIEPSPAKRGRGRPRSESARTNILNVTLELLQDSHVRDITAEAIAKKAGVSKATLYKWWPNKVHIAFDAFMSQLKSDVATPDTGSAERDFVLQLLEAVRFYQSPAGRTLGMILAESHGDEAFHKVLLEQFLTTRRMEVAVMWKRGVERGEIRPDIDMQMGLDILYGPLMFRFLTGRVANMQEWEAEHLVATVFRGFRPPPKPGDEEVWLEA
ncbi:TetR/AcrR family transcriptional regulator [Asticcacaulis tiandongensis]|uniref:TetR/AcrR family transcriptional regulator n=1 Tax=Asticcacaulis tiandongensis TaxID=2565365 RepID=UPI001FE5F9B2|nr:TetR/AcrR family transcriptional regulator [Asticcacaulis tiandongensis]